MSYRNIRYRLYPKTHRKAEQLNKCLGATRFVWNHFLAENREMMQAHRTDDSSPRPSLSFFSLGKEFIELRQQTDWLEELPCAPIRYTLKYYADAWKQCFEAGKGFPKFKAKHYSVDSVTFPAGTYKLTGESLHLQKIGQVALCGSNPYPDCEAKSIVVKKEQDRFHATVCYEVPDERVSMTANGEAIGIDLNVGQFATSGGDISRMADVKVLEARKKRYARQMAGRQKPNHKQGIKPSNRYLKSKRRFNKASKKIRNIRSDWHHQESRTIANAHQYAVVEDLNVQGMTQSAKGDADDPGSNVKQKFGLNREILKTGWFSFRHKLAYKAKLIEVDPKHTSQMCHRCGHIDRDNRRTQARFHCVSCGHSDNADINAALNILALGTRAIGRMRGVCVGNLNDPSRRYAA